MDIDGLAARLLDRLERTGRAQEYQVSESMKLRLEPGPAGSRTLATVGQYRHWPRAEWPELLTAFGIPPGAECHAQIAQGW